jgi:DNA helicase-2/ATP-dependent DNA helicase PcrA
LLIAAGAGTGKTKTLAHRVAHLILNGADPHRLLLLTFTRRAALEMTRRAHQILAEARGDAADRSLVQTAILPWSGTFHSVSSRLLRLHAPSIGLDPSFTILDRSDSADVLDLVRSELGLARTASRFPRKGTCLAIYSYTVNAACPLDETLAQSFPWCADWPTELRRLFEAYVVAKQRDNVLDYDDLLLYWHHAMAEPFVATEIRGCFDHVLVDEYQDTNRLQAEILLALRPDGSGLTVVGDDAQSIYSFRAATVRNILDFPRCFSPPATAIALERNYRSTQPILDAANAVIAGASEQIAKTLYSTKASAERPFLADVEDEAAQARYVADSALDHREAGIALRRQAVLFRTAHHSDLPRSSSAGAIFPSSNMAASNSLRPRMSKTCWRSCAGRRTRATVSPRSGHCSCSPALVLQPRGPFWYSYRKRRLRSAHSHGFRHRPPPPCSGPAFAASLHVCATQIPRGTGRSGSCATGISCSSVFTIIRLPVPEIWTNWNRLPHTTPAASVS